MLNYNLSAEDLDSDAQGENKGQKSLDDWGSPVGGNGIFSGMGYESIDKNGYFTFNLGLELDFDKVGIGIRLPLKVRKGDDGYELKENEWDEASDYLKIITYLRYGHKGDSFYLMLGELRNVQLGHNTIVSGYRNVLDLSHYKFGAVLDLGDDKIKMETLTDNIASPQIIGGRLRFRSGLFGAKGFLSKLGLGISVVTDRKAPSKIEPFEGLKGFKYDPLETESLLFNGIDLDYLLLKTKALTLTPYIDQNFIRNNGSGTHIGIMHSSDLSLMVLRSTWEFRMLHGKYLPRYFNTSYEKDRFLYGDSVGLTKYNYLRTLDNETRSGYFVSLGADILSILSIEGGYEKMVDEEKDGSFWLATSLPSLGPLKAQALYGKTGLDSFSEALDIDDRSYFEAKLIYTSPVGLFIQTGFLRTWENGIPSDQYGGGIGFAYSF